MSIAPPVNLFQDRVAEGHHAEDLGDNALITAATVVDSEPDAGSTAC